MRGLDGPVRTRTPEYVYACTGTPTRNINVDRRHGGGTGREGQTGRGTEREGESAGASSLQSDNSPLDTLIGRRRTATTSHICP
jgi:hypothetical protein